MKDADKTREHLKNELAELRRRIADLEASETERKQAEEALQESERKYRSLFDSMLNGFAYCQIIVDENNKPVDFVYLEINDAFEKLTGLKREDVVGKKVTEAIPGIEESQPALFKIYGEVALTGKPTRFDIYLELLEIWLDIAVYSPQKGYFVAVFENITERKQAEEALKASEARYQDLYENAPDMYVSVDPNTAIILRCNQTVATNLGYTKREIVGRPIFDMYHPDCMDDVKRAFQSFAETGEVRHAELQLKRKDGTKIDVSLNVSAVRDDQGNILYSRSAWRDITERKQAEEREKRLQQELYLSSRLAAIGQLAAGVAHEINNPLTGIMGYSERLLRKPTDENTKKGLEIIHRSSLRVSKIVQNLLTFARRHQPKKEYADINEIVKEALELRAYELKASNIEVALVLASDLPQIMGDFHQLQEVFLNLILNAEQAMTEAHRGGKLIIKTKQLKNHVRISFADDGPGIPHQILDKLFDPFFSTREEKGGTGLGLSICHGIITEHEGKIYAKSKLGKGTTFFVELPLTT